MIPVPSSLVKKFYSIDEVLMNSFPAHGFKIMRPEVDTGLKYTININQERFSALAPGARITEAAVLDFIYYICASPNLAIAKARIVEGEETYTWLDYSHLLNEMPLLRGKSKASLTPLIQKLEDLGFIKTVQKDGFRKYVCLQPLTHDLYSSVKITKRKRLDNLTNHNTNINSVSKDTEQTKFAPSLYAEVIDHYRAEYKRFFKVGVEPSIPHSIVRPLLKQYFLRGYVPKQLNKLITNFLSDVKYSDDLVKNSPSLTSFLKEKTFNKYLSRVNR